jgi:hypothetical protein
VRSTLYAVHSGNGSTVLLQEQRVYNRLGQRNPSSPGRVPGAASTASAVLFTTLQSDTGRVVTASRFVAGSGRHSTFKGR